MGWNRQTKGLTAAFALITLIVAIALAAPALIDLNGQREEVAARIGHIVGGKVTIGGDLAFAILPVPRLTVNDVSLSGLGHVPTLEIRPRWASLLGGAFDIARIIGAAGPADHPWTFDARVAAEPGGAPMPIDLSIRSADTLRSVELSGAVAESAGAKSFTGAVTISRGANPAETLSGALKFNLSLEDKVATLDQASLTLADGAEATLFGILDSSAAAPRFDGEIEIAGPGPASILTPLGVNWTTAKEAAAPVRLTGKVSWVPGRAVLEDGRLDAGSSKTSINLVMATGSRPAIAAAVNTDRIDAAALAGAQWPAALMAGLDINLQARIGQVGLGPVIAKNVDLDASWVGDHLTLNNASAEDVAGLRLALSGGIAGLGADEGPLRLVGLHYVARAGELGSVLAQMGIGSGADGRNLGPASATGTIDGGLDHVVIASRFEAAGGLATLRGQVAVAAGDVRYDLAVEASHSDAAQMIDLFAPDYRSAKPLGGGALSAHLIGGAHAIGITDLRIALGPVNVAGRVDVSLAARPRIDAKLSTGEISIDAFLARATPRSATGPVKAAGAEAHPIKRLYDSGTIEAAPRDKVTIGALAPPGPPHDALSWLDRLDGAVQLDAQALNWGKLRLDGPSAALSIAGGDADLSSFKAGYLGGHVSASGSLSRHGDVTLDAALADAQLHGQAFKLGPFVLSEGRLSGEVALKAVAGSPDTLMRTASGAGHVALADGFVSGFDLKQADEAVTKPGSMALLKILKSGLAGGGTHFSSLTGRFGMNKGLISTNDLMLAAEGGSAKTMGEIDLVENVIDLRTDVTLDNNGGPPIPPLGIIVSGNLDAPTRTADINAIEGWLLGHSLGPALKKAAKIKVKKSHHAALDADRTAAAAIR
jgi:hypothetical protein